MNKSKIEKIEIDLLLDAINRGYGYDFTEYTRPSITRRIDNFLIKTGTNHISELIPKILYDKSFFESFRNNISITVTEMFRDAYVYSAIREKVIPYLKTQPFVKIWHAGCATGEEVYSMAILLQEEGMYERTHIYATDFNDVALEKAKRGIYSIDQIKQHTANYVKAGGEKSFSDYYHSKYDSVIINRELKKNITFANHNLVTDSVFGEMHFILCRNVLIYFNRSLQNHVLDLFYDSLRDNGFLCIGSKESLQFYKSKKDLIEISKKERIYQKKILNE